MSPKYLIWSYEHRAWWRPNSAGYTEDIDQAGRYPPDQCGPICADYAMREIAVNMSRAYKDGPPKFHPYGGKVV